MRPNKKTEAFFNPKREEFWTDRSLFVNDFYKTIRQNLTSHPAQNKKSGKSF